MLVVPAVAPIPENLPQSTNFSVAVSIPSFSCMHKVDLIAQLGERQTEDNVSSHLAVWICGAHK